MVRFKVGPYVIGKVHCARGKHEQQLCCRRQRFLAHGQHHSANAFGEGRAPGFTGHDMRDTLPTQEFG